MDNSSYSNRQNQLHTDSYNLGYSKDPDQYSANYLNNNNQQLNPKPATLNASSISFDILNVNSQMVNTRYDNKSVCASSLYGSKVIKKLKKIFFLLILV